MARNKQKTTFNAVCPRFWDVRQANGLLDQKSNRVLDPTLTNRLVVHVANKVLVQLAISEHMYPCVREEKVIGVRGRGECDMCE